MANLGELLSNPALLEEEAARVGRLCMEEPAGRQDMNESIENDAEFIKFVNRIGEGSQEGYKGFCACGEEDL